MTRLTGVNRVTRVTLIRVQALKNRIDHYLFYYIYIIELYTVDVVRDSMILDHQIT